MFVGNSNGATLIALPNGSEMESPVMQVMGLSEELAKKTELPDASVCIRFVENLWSVDALNINLTPDQARDLAAYLVEAANVYNKME